MFRYFMLRSDQAGRYPKGFFLKVAEKFMYIIDGLEVVERKSGVQTTVFTYPTYIAGRSHPVTS